MNLITLDFSNIKRQDEMHQYLKDTFHFPDFYGCNWDAFWDMIYDYIEHPVIVRIVGLNKMPFELKSDIDKMLEVFEDLHQERPDINIQIDNNYKS